MKWIPHMRIFALPLGSAWSTHALHPGWVATAAWLGLAFLVGGGWALFDKWMRGRVDGLSWNAICYGWPTAMVLTCPVLVLADSLKWTGEPWSDTLALFVTVYFVANLPALIVSALFLVSPWCSALLQLTLCVQEPGWLLVVIAGLVFWMSWFGIIRDLEERWACQILSLRLGKAS